MSVDSPIIVLLEDRPKQRMVFQLNLSIYLDARVLLASSLKEVKRAMNGTEPVSLVIARAQVQGSPVVPKLREFLASISSNVPVVCLGDAAAAPNLTVVGTDNEVKPMLQASAKILGITAKSMVSKQRADTYEIAADFLNLLFTSPCDVFDQGVNGLEKVLSAGSKVPREKIEAFVRNRRSLVIESLQRLKLTNAVTEQSLKATEELTSENVTDERKMALLSASIDMVAAQFRSAGMDEETVKLANASIQAVEKIAESATSVGNLVKQLMEASGGYRYAHCQLITFLGFHVIKMMGWWGDDQRAILSQAAFYHDISLNTDAFAKVRSQKMLAELKDAGNEELLLTHPQLAARELQNAPEISPEVVRVVLQHHGSPIGRGFSTDLSKLDVLAKTFVLSEEWCDYLMELAERDLPADNDGRIAKLKATYPDEQCQQIVETFRYLDPAEFSRGFFEANEVDDFAASLISGGGAGSEAASVVVRPEPTVDTTVAGAAEAAVEAAGSTGAAAEPARSKAGAAPDSAARVAAAKKAKIEARERRQAKLADVAKVKGEAGEKARKLISMIAARKPHATPEEIEQLLAVGGVMLTEEAQKVVEAEQALEEETRLSGGDAADDSETVVAGEAPEAAVKRKVTGVTDVRSDEDIHVAGEGPEAAVKRKVSGVTEVTNDEEIRVAAAKRGPPKLADLERAPGPAGEKARTMMAAIRAKKPDASPEEVEELLKAGGLAKDEEAEVFFKKEAYQDAAATALAAETASAQVSQKIEGVTHHHLDEKIVVKGDNPQDLVDRSITRIKGDPQQKERELKLKALAGNTELQRAALSGAVDEMTKILETNGGELKRTDAEGRTALHYAAMGGSLPAIKFLVEKNLSVNTADSKRRTPLFLAAMYKQQEAFDALIAAGAKANQQAMGGMTILMVAAHNGNMGMLKVALEKGCRPDSKDHAGKTALDHAKAAKHAEIITFLEAAAKPAAPAGKAAKAA